MTGVDEREVADLLGRLVDKSLVVAEEEARRLPLPAARADAPVRARAPRRGGRGDDRGGAPSRVLPRARAGGRSRGARRPGRSSRSTASRPITTTCARRSGWALRHEPEQALRAGRPHVADVDGRQSLPGGQPLAGRGARGGPGADRAARGGAARGVRAARSAWGGRAGSASWAPSGSRSSGRWATARAVAHALDEVGVYEYMAGRYDRAERLYAESRALAEELGDRKVLGGGPALRGRARPVPRRLRGRPRGAAGQPDPVARAARGRRRPVLPGPHRRPVRRGGGTGRGAADVLRGDRAVLSPRGRRGARSATSWPRSATSRAPRG